MQAEPREHCGGPPHFPEHPQLSSIAPCRKGNCHHPQKGVLLPECCVCPARDVSPHFQTLPSSKLLEAPRVIRLHSLKIGRLLCFFFFFSFPVSNKLLGEYGGVQGSLQEGGVCLAAPARITSLVCSRVLPGRSGCSVRRVWRQAVYPVSLCLCTLSCSAPCTPFLNRILKFPLSYCVPLTVSPSRLSLSGQGTAGQGG